MAVSKAVTMKDESGTFEIEIEWDDPKIEEPYDGVGALTKFKVTNTTGRSYEILFKRVNGTTWQSRTVQSGQTFEFPPAGPVRNLGDVPFVQVKEA